MYLSSASLSKLGNLELSQVKEEKYEHKEAQYHMDHGIHIKYFHFYENSKKGATFYLGRNKGSRPFQGLSSVPSTKYALGTYFEC